MYQHYREERPINELWEDDKKELLILPNDHYDVFRYEVASVNKLGMIHFDKNRYSVSPELSRQKVQIKAYFDRIEIFHDGKYSPDDWGKQLSYEENCYGKHDGIRRRLTNSYTVLIEKSR